MTTVNYTINGSSLSGDENDDTTLDLEVSGVYIRGERDVGISDGMEVTEIRVAESGLEIDYEKLPVKTQVEILKLLEETYEEDRADYYCGDYSPCYM